MSIADAYSEIPLHRCWLFWRGAGLLYVCFLRGLILSLFGDFSRLVLYILFDGSEHNRSDGFCQVLKAVLARVCQCAMF